MHKITASGKKVGVVPDHKEVQKGTLRSISKMTEVDKQHFGL